MICPHCKGNIEVLLRAINPEAAYVPVATGESSAVTPKPIEKPLGRPKSKKLKPMLAICSPLPGKGEPWDWMKRYFNVGDRIKWKPRCGRNEGKL